MSIDAKLHAFLAILLPSGPHAPEPAWPCLRLQKRERPASIEDMVMKGMASDLSMSGMCDIKICQDPANSRCFLVCVGVQNHLRSWTS